MTITLEPIDLTYLCKTPGVLRELAIKASAKCISEKGSGGPQSYAPLLARLGKLSSGKETLDSLVTWAGASGVEDFRPHVQAGARGFDALFQSKGGRWIPVKSEPFRVAGKLFCNHGVKAVWLHDDFRRACIVNLRNTFVPSKDAISFLLRACFESYVRDEPNINEPCVVDVSRFAEVATGDPRARRANVFTPHEVPMMDLEEYEYILRRFWAALELSEIVRPGDMPRDIVGTLFARPQAGL